MIRPVLADRAVAEKAEQMLLSTFWFEIRRGYPRLELLLAYTRLKVLRADDWDPEAIRVAHRTNQGQPGSMRLDKACCFSCGANVQLYAHHIIEIQHGGSNTIRNQTALCFDCHQYLHPWLTDADRAPKPHTHDFESIGEVLVRHASDAIRGDGS